MRKQAATRAYLRREALEGRGKCRNGHSRGVYGVHKDGSCRECARMRVRKYKYGLQPHQFEKMWEAAGGKCEICGTPMSRTRDDSRGKGGYTIDHCHTTRQVRGILCVSCNIALGHVKDDPELLSKMAEYLTRKAK